MRHQNSMFDSINNNQFLVIDSKSSPRQGIKQYMLFKEFIQQNIDQLEIPFQPDRRKKYPPTVWLGLHKSLLVNQLQHYRRVDTIESFINTVYGGDDLGGLTIDNVIDMWLESMTTTMNQVIGSALGNSKIKKLYNELVTEREVECSDAHNETEEQIVDKGVKLPVHHHTVMSIDVNDDNREQFDEFIDVVLRNFDSETYGELPIEYSKARESDIENMITELKDLVGDSDILSSLTSKKGGSDSSDYV